MADFEAKPIEEIQKALAKIKVEVDGDVRYDFPSRKPPAGYVTLRDCYRVSESHPSWLRNMLSDNGFDKWNVEGAPAAIKNKRGVWGIRIDALQAYDETKRQPGESTGTGGGYKYEPQVLKSVKRAVTAVDTYASVVPGLAEAKAPLQALADHLKKLWDDGTIGKESNGEDEDEDEGEGKAETAGDAAEPEPEEDLDFEFDLSEGDK